GVALIEVPAGPGLYDSYDRSLHHFRRYSAAALRRMVRAAGLTVIRASHLGASVYPAFSLVKRIRQRNDGGKADLAATRNVIDRTRQSRALDFCLAAELAIGRTISYPFGIRCLLTCRKPTSGAV